MVCTDGNLNSVLETVLHEASQIEDWGKPADYILPLSLVDPRQVSISVYLADGTLTQAGQYDTSFSIQSISKVFSLALAMGRYGDALWQVVGREPSGTHFASLLSMEGRGGRPSNPFENAGAIAVTGALLAGYKPKETLAELLRFVRDLAGDGSIVIDEEVARCEKATGHRNTAIAHLLRSNGILKTEAELALGVYFHQCAIRMTTEQLARAGATFAQLDCAALTLPAERMKRINALMMTCGLYDQSGDFAFEVGLPAKSGVGGGLLISVPQRASIAIWAPGLNYQGNSKVGIFLARRLTEEMGWSIFR